MKDKPAGPSVPVSDGMSDDDALKLIFGRAAVERIKKASTPAGKQTSVEDASSVDHGDTCGACGNAKVDGLCVACGN